MLSDNDLTVTAAESTHDVSIGSRFAAEKRLGGADLDFGTRIWRWTR
jgi:hypothetical protein